MVTASAVSTTNHNTISPKKNNVTKQVTISTAYLFKISPILPNITGNTFKDKEIPLSYSGKVGGEIQSGCKVVRGL